MPQHNQNNQNPTAWNQYTTKYNHCAIVKQQTTYYNRATFSRDAIIYIGTTDMFTKTLRVFIKYRAKGEPLWNPRATSHPYRLGWWLIRTAPQLLAGNEMARPKKNDEGLKSRLVFGYLKPIMLPIWVRWRRPVLVSLTFSVSVYWPIKRRLSPNKSTGRSETVAIPFQ